MTPTQASTPQPASDRPRSRGLSRRFEIGAADDDAPLATLIYRSTATATFGVAELGQLLEHARTRNRSLSITGMLVYDDGCFFQWLEGPSMAVDKLWRAIQLDPRHRDVRLLGQHSIPVRLFGDWEMRLAYGKPQNGHEGNDECHGETGGDWPDQTDLAGIGHSVPAPSTLLERLYTPDTLFPEVWVDLSRLHGDAVSGEQNISVPALETLDLVSELALRSMQNDPEIATRFIDSLLAQGLSAESICLDLFEPAARHMGKLWSEEACSEIDVTAGVCRLQALTRHLGGAFRARVSSVGDSRSVLLATQPGEPHMLGVGLAAQFFWQAGWNVLCEFPASNEALATLVKHRWFDLLDLSLSGVFTREHRLLNVSKTIAAARAASQNPAMVVLVNGRVFLNRPELAVVVGANAAYSRVGQAVSKANRMLKPSGSKAFVATQRLLREVECRVTESSTLPIVPSGPHNR
jgi:blue light- and temperature-responsive anti-repressor